jgi:hypothetical protein
MEETKSSSIVSVDVTPITVVDWISYESADTYPISFEDRNIYWDKGMRWIDYFTCLDKYEKQYAQALYKEMTENNIKITGYEHITSSCGIPKFSDGTVAMMAIRDFAKLQAAIWSEKENFNYGYTDFAF